MQKLPRDKENDYTREMASQRRDVVNAETGSNLEHVGSYSIDPGVLPGNIENFAGVAQVPLGFAGPMLVNGEHAKGEFYVPMATSEGTLVASTDERWIVARDEDAVGRVHVHLPRQGFVIRAI